MRKKVEFGDEMRDGEITPHPIERDIIKYIFEKHSEYCEHPPEDLVRDIIEDYRMQSKTITYEEAEGKVALDNIWQRIADEINEKWGDYLTEERLKKLNFSTKKQKSGLEQPAKNIISEDDWKRLETFCHKGLEDKGQEFNSPPVQYQGFIL